MSATIRDAFDYCKSNLELNKTLQDSITAHHNAIRKWIESFNPSIKTQLIGSLQRQTRIRPRTDDLFDIDILVILGAFDRWVPFGGVLPGDALSEEKKIIFKRDGYRCVICARGVKDGVEIQADHIKAKDLGGRAEISNGQTLCAQHNFQKKNYKQTESGKKMFIRLYELAKVTNDPTMINFCKEVLKTFDKHDINGHIPWKK